jgi:hypothetical protein
MMKNIRGATNLDMALIDPKNASPQAQSYIKGLKAGYGNQLADLTAKYKEADAEYKESVALAAAHKISVPTAPSGALDNRAQRADLKAKQDAAAKARRSLSPAVVLPPGAPHPPGTQQGLYARPAPKKKPLGKKSTSDPLGIR